MKSVNRNRPWRFLFTASRVSDATAARIFRLAQLKAGWLFGRGEAPTQTGVTNALRVLSKLNDIGASNTEAFPTEAGSVVVSGYHGAESVDVTCKSNGKFDYCHEVGDEDFVDETDLSFAALISRLRELKWRKQSFSDFFTHSNIVGNDVALTALQSSHRTTDYQLYGPRVPARQAAVSAPTSENIILAVFRENRQSFSGSGDLNSRNTKSSTTTQMATRATIC